MIQGDTRFLALNAIPLVLSIGIHMFNLNTVDMVGASSELAAKDEGIAAFLHDPTRYNFLCTAESTGEVLSASWSENGNLCIAYKSLWSDGDHSGKVLGTYDEDSNKFTGAYQTNDRRFSGEISFSFNKEGEAFGTWDHGFGVIKIALKRKYVRK